MLFEIAYNVKKLMNNVAKRRFRWAINKLRNIQAKFIKIIAHLRSWKNYKKILVLKS